MAHPTPTCMADRSCWSLIFISRNDSKAGLMEYYILMTRSHLERPWWVWMSWRWHYHFKPHNCPPSFCEFCAFLNIPAWPPAKWFLLWGDFWIEAAFDPPMWRGADMKASLCCHLHRLCLLHGNRFCAFATSATMTSHFTFLQFIQGREAEMPEQWSSL